jgi:phospholipid-binding lipoprotein MlaA
MIKHRALLTVIVFILGISGCAQVPTDPTARAEFDHANDPAEPTNRKIFAANQFVDRHALKPVATAYADHVPVPVRRSLRNFVTNLGAPVVLINDVLQGNAALAWTTTRRFVINTTIGFAGFFDPASTWGMPQHSADFGQTFGVWGIGSGPSVQLPLLGFSDVRDSVGTVIGFVANPLNYIPGATMTDILVAGSGVGVVGTRAELLPTTDSLERSSLDYYAALRSLTAQQRAGFVEDGKQGRTGARRHNLSASQTGTNLP